MNFRKQIQLFYKVLCLAIFNLNVLAQESPIKQPLGNFEIRILKKEKHHLHTAALLCARHLENENRNGDWENKIHSAWPEHLQESISPDDEFLVAHIMKGMCPEIKENGTVLH